MNKHIKKTLLLFSIFLSSLASISAQYYCGIIRPENQQQVMTDIVDCFSRGINVSQEAIATFLLAEEGWYSEDIPAPKINFVGYGHELFNIDWEDVPNATMYRVRVLNLIDGSELGRWPNTSNISVSIERETLYLSLFSTIIWDGISFQKSADFIIIDELPVIRDSVIYDCSCASGLNNRNNRSVDVSNSARESLNISIYPNPSNAAINLEYQLKTSQEVSIWIVDAFGNTQTVVQPTTRKNEGSHQLYFPIERLTPGWYHCLIKTEKALQQQAFLKIP